VTVRGQKRIPPRAVSDFVLPQEVLAIAPRRSASELLTSAPGIYVSRPGGEAVAQEVFLRGFNAEHGQDIELTLGPIPINQLSHIHGQGYADLNFIIPEVVRAMRVTEGVYDPRQGDFAVAGSVDFDLGVTERGYRLATTYGSFGTWRQLVLWAPRDEPPETFVAASLRKSDGFGTNRASLFGGAIAQYAFEGPGGFRGLLHVTGFGARANTAGVLRKDDVEAGLVDFYGVYPNPSANSQSALSSRAQLLLGFERATAAGARTGLAAWLAFTDFRFRSNFTGFTERSQVQPLFVGRGDLLEQSNRDIGLGARAFHRTERWRPAEWLSGSFELGLSLRTHFIDQAQNLIEAPQNETWDRRVDASIHASDLGLYLDTDWRLTRFFRLRGGLRADVLYYDIDDRLGNFIPSFQRQTHIVGFRRTALGFSFGPRVTAEALPLRWLDLMVSYGQGYRSPQARQLEEGENAPFATVHSAEVGLRFRPLGDDRLALTVAAYWTTLSLDVAFDPESGSLEKVGPTTRKGVMALLLARPWKWLWATASLTYVHATLDAPPPATAENPSPPYVPGQLLPYVPPLVLRAELGVHHALLRLGQAPLTGKLGLAVTHLSARPLPFSRFADPFTLTDLSASLRWRWVELGLEALNLFQQRYAMSEFTFVSNWGLREIPSHLPARHFAAGPPRTVLGTLTFHL
jgi:iron complex outermembrane receptor protein